MSVLVVLVIRSLAVMVSRVASRELYILIHPKIVLDVFLHVDVPEAGSYVRPVRLMVVVRVVVMWMSVVWSRLLFSGLQR